MNTLEDRVRAATRAAADTVPPDSVPPLRLPPSSRAHKGRRRRARPWSRWAPWMAPLAAAVAVITIAVAMVTLGRSVHGSLRTAGVTPTAGRPTYAPTNPTPIGPASKTVAGPPVSAYVSSGQIPPYYVTLESHGSPVSNPSYAVVRDTVTGTALATIRPTVPGGTIVAVTAAADDRTFVLDEQPWLTVPGSNQSYAARTFYRVRLDSAGQPGPVTRLSMSLPYGHMLTGLALSPDGSKLAMAVEVVTDKKNPNLVQVTVYTLASGASRTWTGTGGIGFGSDDARSLSWTADGQTLAFDWGGTGGGPWQGEWLLNPAHSVGSLLASSRQAVSWEAAAQAPPGSASDSASPSAVQSLVPGAPPPSQPTLVCEEDAIITLDGSTVVCGAQRILSPYGVPGSNAQPKADTAFLEYSTATGEITRVLGHWTFTAIPTPELLWSNASGSVLIGITGSHDQVGVISGNEFTPLKAATNTQPDNSGTW